MHIHILYIVTMLTYQTNLEKVIIVQKRLLRLITGSPYRAHTEALFVASRILTFEEINEFASSVFMFKSQNDDLSEFFYNYYQTHRDVHEKLEMLMLSMYHMGDLTLERLA